MSSGGYLGYLTTGDFFPPVESTIVKSLLDAKADTDEKRRADMAKRIDLFEDDHLSMVRQKLAKQYTIENFGEVFKTIDVSNNLAKKIIRQISTVYDKPPIWKFAKGVDDKGVWAELREQSKWNLIAPRVNQITNLCNECFVRIAVVRGKLTYHVIPPHLISVEQDPEDPTQIIAIRYWVGNENTSNDTGYWHYWDARVGKNGKGSHRIYTETGKDVSAKFGIDGVNPYTDAEGCPVIPGVMYHRELPTARVFDQTSGHDLVDGTVMVNAMESILNHLFRTDGYAQKWISGQIDEAAMAAQVGGTMRFLMLRNAVGEAVATGQYASQADWQGLKGVIEGKISTLCNNYGLSSAALEVDSTAASGFSLVVRKFDQIEQRKRQLPLYAIYDRELYAKTALVWNYERANVRGNVAALGVEKADGAKMLTEDEADPQIIYAKYQVPQTPAEEAQRMELDEKRLAMGLVSVIDLVREERPDLDEAEAEELLMSNHEINRRLGGAASPAHAPMVPPVDGVPNPDATPPDANPSTPSGKPHIAALVTEIAAKLKAAKEAK